MNNGPSIGTEPVDSPDLPPTPDYPPEPEEPEEPKLKDRIVLKLKSIAKRLKR